MCSAPIVAKVTIVALAFLTTAPALAAPPPIHISVDASEAPRHILHTHLTIPAQPGPLALTYPKWIPGEHGPNGPIGSVVGLQISAAGKPVPWRRDDENMYAFAVDVPAGTSELDVKFDLVPSGSGARFTAEGWSSARLAILNWNQVVLVPRGAKARDVLLSASLTVPQGWKISTSLGQKKTYGARTDFATVSLETLVDSPVLTAEFLRNINLSSDNTLPHRLNLAGDSEAAIAINDEIIGRYRKLVLEAGALFGGRPYRHYDFLLALSDQVAHFGLEHHESNDSRQRERTFLDDGLRVLGAGLLPHEFVHSWNGKFRRPTGLVTATYEEPMHGELLWIYEGLTAYVGNVLTVRSGLRTAEQGRELLALSAATLAMTAGRAWRPLGDTAVAAQILYGMSREWRSWRRGVDFYPEGELIWLEADALIRKRTGGKKSLDDFCRIFHRAPANPPVVSPYTLDDAVRVLNDVAPLDWRAFFKARVDQTTGAALRGIEAAGWQLVYRDMPTAYLKSAEQATKTIELSFSLGLALKDDGSVLDVIPGSAAAKAGVAPGMKVIAVGGRRFTPDLIKDAVRGSKAKAKVELMIENGDEFRSVRLDYNGGPRYPALEPVPGRANLLGRIFDGLIPSRNLGGKDGSF